MVEGVGKVAMQAISALLLRPGSGHLRHPRVQSQLLITVLFFVSASAKRGAPQNVMGSMAGGDDSEGELRYDLRTDFIFCNSYGAAISMRMKDPLRLDRFP